MTSVPVVDVILVVLEFIALFVATWIAWFAVITVYQMVTRWTKTRHVLKPSDSAISD
jgi:hypothetical protein